MGDPFNLNGQAVAADLVRVIAKRDALAAAVERAEALHCPVDIEPSDTICHECSFQLPNGRYFGKVVEHPCPTLQALRVNADA